MVNRMVNSYYYNGNIYRPRTQSEKDKGFILATIASGAILRALPLCGKPFMKQLSKEQLSNHLYKDAFEKSIDISGLKPKGLRLIPMQNYTGNSDYILGTNAAYFPKEKVIRINTDKISIAGFHEVGHALNDLSGKFGKILSKMRWPGRSIALLLGYVALFTRSKPKDAPKDKLDFIKDNCGKLAFASMLPTVFEEGMASYKGIQLAKKTGLSKTLINNMKKLYGKALLTYIGHATLTGVAVGAASMIMDHFSRPKKIKTTDSPFLFG